jgi:hypothetical protein
MMEGGGWLESLEYEGDKAQVKEKQSLVGRKLNTLGVEVATKP